MSMTFRQSVDLPVPRNAAFAWHRRPGAFERLKPPWEKIEVVDRRGTIENGDGLVMSMSLGPVPIRWEARHEGFIENEQFRDIQVRGPFARWEHTHRFEAIDDSRCRMTDSIEYAPPLGALGRIVGGGALKKKLATMFAYRHAVTMEDLIMHDKHKDEPRLRVAITGASGLVGRALCHMLTTGGHEVIRMRRRSMGGDASVVAWNVEQGLLTPSQLEGVDAVVHLAGESIAEGRWTDAKMKAIRNSRVEGTRNLVSSLCALEKPPKTFICASAIGYYGDRGDEVLDEESSPGRGFLADVCRAWEEAAQPADDVGMRVVNARLGVVLSPQGGALAKMLTPFKLGLGGCVGSGDQYMSWISLDDACGALVAALMDNTIAGPVNVVSPTPVTNREFTKTLGRVLHRPTVAPLPAFAARLAFGKMADELLLASARVMPGKLEASGHRFRHRLLEDALRHVLGRASHQGAEAAVN